MTEPVYFVVTRRNGIEEPALIYGRLPEALTGHRAAANGLVWAIRLDKLPHVERHLTASLAELYATFVRLRTAGTLPAPNLAEPARKTPPARRLLGEWWEPPARNWPDSPAGPWPQNASNARRRRRIGVLHREPQPPPYMPAPQIGTATKGDTP
jgi:hypothetical protein